MNEDTEFESDVAARTSVSVHSPRMTPDGPASFVVCGRQVFPTFPPNFCPISGGCGHSLGYEEGKVSLQNNTLTFQSGSWHQHGTQAHLGHAAQRPENIMTNVPSHTETVTSINDSIPEVPPQIHTRCSTHCELVITCVTHRHPDMPRFNMRDH